MLLRRGNQVLNIDKLTDSADLAALSEWEGTPRYTIAQGDVCDLGYVLSVLEDFQPDCIIHAAAETNTDRAVDSTAQFLQTNFIGTYTMLEAARHWWAGRRGDYRFLQISTNEVYGGLSAADPGFSENAAYAPNSPFAASKAAADHLVRAWGQTYGLPVVTTHSSNNYGPWQSPEKLIPLMITNGAEGEALPIKGAGIVRDWVHVADHAQAVRTVLERGEHCATYNIGGSAEQPHAEIVHMICAELDRRFPERAPHSRMILHSDDQQPDVARQAVDTSKIWRDLRWRPETEFRSGLSKTVDWYLDNRPWWQRIRQTRTDGDRRGQRAA